MHGRWVRSRRELSGNAFFFRNWKLGEITHSRQNVSSSTSRSCRTRACNPLTTHRIRCLAIILRDPLRPPHLLLHYLRSYCQRPVHRNKPSPLSVSRSSTPLRLRLSPSSLPLPVSTEIVGQLRVDPRYEVGSKRYVVSLERRGRRARRRGEERERRGDKREVENHANLERLALA